MSLFKFVLYYTISYCKVRNTSALRQKPYYLGPGGGYSRLPEARMWHALHAREVLTSMLCVRSPPFAYLLLSMRCEKRLSATKLRLKQLPSLFGLCHLFEACGN